MINRYEAVGISLSIAAMVLALFLLRFETTNQTVAVADSQNQAATIVVSGEGDAAFADAYIDASNATGDLQKLIIDDVTVGSGDEVMEGDQVTVHYIGALQNGQQFDDSYRKGVPFTFTVGGGDVIPGWERGLLGMQVGGERILVIPSDLGYGDDGFGPIPGGASLVFTIELLAIN